MADVDRLSKSAVTHPVVIQLVQHIVQQTWIAESAVRTGNFCKTCQLPKWVALTFQLHQFPNRIGKCFLVKGSSQAMVSTLDLFKPITLVTTQFDSVSLQGIERPTL